MKTLIPFLILCLIATCNAELRTWTAINGKKVEAEFVSNSDGQVTLKMKTGKVFRVPLDKLSKEDQDFIASIALLLSLIHISEPTRLRRISYAVFCLKKKKK